MDDVTSSTNMGEKTAGDGSRPIDRLDPETREAFERSFRRNEKALRKLAEM